jgi:exopolyphosphatase/pppGpp-phosphohydrolase
VVAAASEETARVSEAARREGTIFSKLRAEVPTDSNKDTSSGSYNESENSEESKDRRERTALVAERSAESLATRKNEDGP